METVRELLLVPGTVAMYEDMAPATNRDKETLGGLKCAIRVPWSP